MQVFNESLKSVGSKKIVQSVGCNRGVSCMFVVSRVSVRPKCPVSLVIVSIVVVAVLECHLHHFALAFCILHGVQIFFLR